MKTPPRMLSALASSWLAISLLAACGGSTEEPKTAADPDPEALLGDEPEAVPASSPEVKQAMEAIQNEDFEGAKATLEPLAKDSSDPQVFYYLGVAQANTGEVDAAVASLERALQLDPKLTDASLNLAAFLLDQGQPEQALSVLDEGLKHAPGDPALTENKALALLMTGDAKGAAKLYAAVVEKRPDDEELRFTYAQALAGAGQKESASQQLFKLQGSKSIAVLNSSADMFGRLGQFDDCIAFVDKAIAIEAKSELYVRRGLCKGGKADPAGAQADFKKAVEADESSATAHFYLGKSLEAKDKKAAKAEFAKVIELAGDNAKLKAAAEKALSAL